MSNLKKSQLHEKLRKSKKRDFISDKALSIFFLVRSPLRWTFEGSWGLLGVAIESS